MRVPERRRRRRAGPGRRGHVRVWQPGRVLAGKCGNFDIIFAPFFPFHRSSVPPCAPRVVWSTGRHTWYLWASDTDCGLQSDVVSEFGPLQVLRAFQSRALPATFFACALAVERLPNVAAAIRESGFDVCCHGWRWEDHIDMSPTFEASRIKRAIASLTRTLGGPPAGWYCRTAPSVSTRRLLLEHGGFVYDSDAYNDDLPYWVEVKVGDGADAKRWHLVVPSVPTPNPNPNPQPQPQPSPSLFAMPTRWRPFRITMWWWWWGGCAATPSGIAN